MSWKKYTKNDLISILSQEELNIYKQSFDEDMLQNNVIETIISSNTARIRGYLRKSNVVKMSKDTSLIPESLFSACGILSRYDLLTRMPVEMTEVRQKQLDSTIDFLKSIAKNEFIPEGIGSEEEEREDDSQTSFPKPKINGDRFKKLNTWWY